MEPEADPVVIRDVFPADVTVGGSVYRTARAVVTRERVYVYLARGGERVKVLEAGYDPSQSSVAAVNAPRMKATHLQLLAPPDAPTEDPVTTLHINGVRGCGCGNPLKAWQPWAPWRVGS